MFDRKKHRDSILDLENEALRAGKEASERGDEKNAKWWLERAAMWSALAAAFTAAYMSL